MGLRGSGLDDNSDVFGPQLEKFIARTDLPPRNAAETYSAPVETPTTTPKPTNKAPAAKPSQPPQPGNDPTVTPDMVNAPSNTGGSGWDWLKWLLPGAVGVGGAALIRKGMEVPRPPEGYPGTVESGMKPGPLAETAKNVLLTDPRIPPNRRLTYDDTQTKTITSDPKLTEQARTNQLKAEIDAENARQAAEEADKQRLLAEIQRRQEVQRNTAETLKAAKASQTPRRFGK